MQVRFCREASRSDDDVKREIPWELELKAFLPVYFEPFASPVEQRGAF